MAGLPAAVAHVPTWGRSSQQTQGDSTSRPHGVLSIAAGFGKGEREEDGGSCCYYSLFTFSWPRSESGSLGNGGMLTLRIYFAVDGMPIEMYGESWIAGLLTSDDIILYMAGFGTTRGI